MSGIVASFEKTAFSSGVQLLFRWGWHPGHPQPQLIVVTPLLQFEAIPQTDSKSNVLSARDAECYVDAENASSESRSENCFFPSLGAVSFRRVIMRVSKVNHTSYVKMLNAEQRETYRITGCRACTTWTT